MNPVSYDSDLWNQLKGAYGNVCDDVRILYEEKEDIEMPMRLNRMDKTKKTAYRVTFDNLCENLSHQLDFYEATYLVIPYMAKLLEKKMQKNDAEWQILIISGIGLSLISDTRKNRTKTADKEIIRNYKKSLRYFKRLVKRCCKKNRKYIKKLDFDEKSQFVTAVSAVLGNRRIPLLMIMGFSMFPEAVSKAMVSIAYFLERLSLFLFVH